MSNPEPRSALAAHWHAGPHGAKGPAPIAIGSPKLEIVHLTARRNRAADLHQRISAAMSLTLPTAGTSLANGTVTAYAIAPETWLLTSPYGIEGRLLELVQRAGGDAGSPVDQTHGKTALRVSGPRVRDMLDKLCRLDLHPREFATGACAMTLMAHVSVLIARVDQGQPGEAPVFDLIAPANFAVTFLEAVETASQEFGYTLAER